MSMLSGGGAPGGFPSPFGAAGGCFPPVVRGPGGDQGFPSPCFPLDGPGRAFGLGGGGGGGDAWMPPAPASTWTPQGPPTAFFPLHSPLSFPSPFPSVPATGGPLPLSPMGPPQSPCFIPSPFLPQQAAQPVFFGAGGIGAGGDGMSGGGGGLCPSSGGGGGVLGGGVWGEKRVSPALVSSSQVPTPPSTNGGPTPRPQVYSRKVFLGGLPIDITEEVIMGTFRRFGRLVIDWPRKTNNKIYYPPKGYAFLVFEQESGVEKMLRCCIEEEDSHFLPLYSPSRSTHIHGKAVHVRPWKLSDAEWNWGQELKGDESLTIDVIGIPRPLKASELCGLVEKEYGGVEWGSVEMDPLLKYPKCQGRVRFNNRQSYVAALTHGHIRLQLREMDKRAVMKPSGGGASGGGAGESGGGGGRGVCGECGGGEGMFCGQSPCFRYLCQKCWIEAHDAPNLEHHAPLSFK